MAVWIQRLLFAFLVGLLGVLATLTPPGLQMEEDFGLPWLFRLRGATPAPPDVMVVAIDKASSSQLGLPTMPSLWPRDVHVRLIDKLSSAGAKVIAFDLRFDTRGAAAQQDEALANAMVEAGNVLIVERLDREEHRLPTDQAGATYVGGSMVRTAALHPVIADAAAALATFPLPKVDRVNDYWAFKADAGEAPTLPVVALQLFALDAYGDFFRLLRDASPSLASRLADNRNALPIEDLILTLRGIFTDEPRLAQQMLAGLNQDSSLDQKTERLIRSLVNLYSGDEIRYLNFYGPPRTVRTIPYHQALGIAYGSAAGEATENDFKGKAVFVGFSAATQPEQDRIRDDYHTVFSRSDGLYLSGVEIAATAFANLLEDRPLRPLPLSLNLAVVFLWGLAIAIAGAALPQPTTITLCTVFVLLGLALISTYVYIAHRQFADAGNWMPLVVPLLQVPVAVFGAISLKYYEVKREREILKKAFAKFVPQRVVSDILESSGPITANNRLVQGACLATDADMYTTLSEQMDPAQLGVLMNNYYAAMFEPVSRHEGLVSDVVGDAMLAIWSAPSGDESSLRKKACLACLEIAAALERFNATNDATNGRPPLYTRMGLHAGEMLLGTVGALHHYEYRAVGDMVNTANRIQGLNKYLDTRLLVSEKVVEGLDEFLTRPLGRFLLAGRASFLRVAELMGRKQDASSEQTWLAEIFVDAVLAYEAQDWPRGCRYFSEILKAFPHDGPARFYLKRCQDFQQAEPLGSWDGCIRVKGK
jgi:adenylate cyclase